MVHCRQHLQFSWTPQKAPEPGYSLPYFVEIAGETIMVPGERTARLIEAVEARNRTIQDQARTIERFRAEIERRKQNEKWYQWTYTADLIAKEGINNIIKHINTECNTKEEISKYLWNESFDQAQVILDRFWWFLENYNEADSIRRDVIEIFLNIKAFPIHFPTITHYMEEQSFEEDTNDPLRTHTFTFSDEYSVRKSADCSTLNAEGIKNIRPVIDLFSHDFEIRDSIPKGEASYTTTRRYRWICHVLNQVLPEEEELVLYLGGRTLEGLGVEAIPGNSHLTPPLSLLCGKGKLVSTFEVKGLPANLDLTSLPQSLAGLFDDTLSQMFEYMMVTKTRYGILSFGVVNILVTISVEEFFENPERFARDHIVPHEFIIVRMDDPIGIELNFILEAKRESYDFRVEEMAGYYEAPVDSDLSDSGLSDLQPPAKRRRTQVDYSKYF